MVNRRSVMKISAATVASGLLKISVLGRTDAPSQVRTRFERAIFDERFAECQAFAAELRSSGVLCSAIRGDVAKLWYSDLRMRLSTNRAPVAGMTDRAALFFLEELARDLDMRVIFRADHVIDRDAGVNAPAQHMAAGLASLAAVARNLAPNAGFGRSMGRLLRQADIGEARDSSAQKRTGPFSPENKTALVSWMIA